MWKFLRKFFGMCDHIRLWDVLPGRSKRICRACGKRQRQIWEAKGYRWEKE
jgi:hypothetical protein